MATAAANAAPAAIKPVPKVKRMDLQAAEALVQGLLSAKHGGGKVELSPAAEALLKRLKETRSTPAWKRRSKKLPMTWAGSASGEDYGY